VRPFLVVASMIALLNAAFTIAVGAVIDEPALSVDDRIAAWEPTVAEKRFDTIGWVADIRTAIKLGKEHGRPVFVFTYNGRMGSGRQ